MDVIFPTYVVKGIGSMSFACYDVSATTTSIVRDGENGDLARGRF